MDIMAMGIATVNTSHTMDITAMDIKDLDMKDLTDLESKHIKDAKHLNIKGVTDKEVRAMDIGEIDIKHMDVKEPVKAIRITGGKERPTRRSAGTVDLTGGPLWLTKISHVVTDAKLSDGFQ
ncbi:hypothetical protein ACOMHN_044102 [Nucella lapillus]